MSIATVIPLPLRPATSPVTDEAVSAADVTKMLDGAIRYWAAVRFRCPFCQDAEGGMCQRHQDSGRYSFAAGLLRDGLDAAGEEVTASLIALGRTARKDARAGLPYDGGEPA